MKKLLLVGLVGLGLVGCSAPVSHNNVALSTYDKDTEYAITNANNGFAVTLYYSKYQYFPDSPAVEAGCKSQLLAIAWDNSDNLEREIFINEQRIRISMGRNGLTGITSCQATVKVKFVEPKQIIKM